MNFLEWSKSSVDYGQRLVNSALEGAREGEEDFLKEDSLSPLLTDVSATCAAAGLDWGLLRRIRWQRGPSGADRLRGPLLSACWVERSDLAPPWLGRTGEISASVASGAWKRIQQTRDERWFEKTSDRLRIEEKSGEEGATAFRVVQPGLTHKG